jgi:hypothetical protein
MDVKFGSTGIRHTSDDQVTELVYELLDAHADTIKLAEELADDLGWAAHLGYLRDLQRVGREALAGLTDARSVGGGTSTPPR